MAKLCYEYAEYSRKDAILVEAQKKMAVGGVANYQAAIALLATVPGWRNADVMANECRRRLGNIQ